MCPCRIPHGSAACSLPTARPRGGSAVDRAALAPLTCGWGTAPAPPCHPLGHVPSAGSGGHFWHGCSIIIDIRGAVLGWGLCHRHRGRGEPEAVQGSGCATHLWPDHWGCPGATGAAGSQPEPQQSLMTLMTLMTATAELAPLAEQGLCPLVSPAPGHVPSPWGSPARSCPCVPTWRCLGVALLHTIPNVIRQLCPRPL